MAENRTFLERNWPTFVSIAAGVFAVVQFWEGSQRAEREANLRKAEIIGHFVPHLQNPETRDAAILALQELIDPKVAVALAKSFQAKKALEQVAQNSASPAQKQATDAVKSLDADMDRLVGQIYAGDKETRIKATTELVRNRSNDQDLVQKVLAAAPARTDNSSGTINALVVLESAPPATLQANREAVQKLIDKAEANGPQTAQWARKLREKLNPPDQR